MCGIAGIIGLASDDSLSGRIDCMVRVQSHRGPNGEGRWRGQLDGTQVVLGHGRLAILDLSEGGRQPMVSPCGKRVLVYNGEVYNYRELREELESLGVVFRTQCDTEVVLQALIAWGDNAFKKFNGMWALAYLDLEKRQILFSRDRFGIKPLYYYQSRDAFYFGSEIKAILSGTGERFRIHKPAVSRYLLQSLLDAQPETFFEGIRAVPPGHNLTIDLASSPWSLSVPRPYWRISDQDGFEGNEGERQEAVRATFVDAVRLRLRSDVPVGVLLSGGLDSSAIVAAMQTVLGRGADLHILSAVSDDLRFSEGPFIDRMTAHLGAEVQKVPLCIRPEEAWNLWERVTWANDEPVGSFSNVAHFLLMQEARRRGVTVILSGQGGDETLCGYKKYLGFYIQSLLKRGRLVKGLKVAVGFHRQGTVIRQFRLQEAKRYLPGRRLLRLDVRGPVLKNHDKLLDTGLRAGSIVSRQIADIQHFSVPALVHYEDRMSMAWSREIRLPFLDYRMVNMLVPLDPEWKLRDGWTKWIFRRVMEPLLPKEIAWRKDKQGFTLPSDEWMKNELRLKIEDFLNGPMLTADAGLVGHKKVRQLFHHYCRQRAEKGLIASKDIFGLVALEVWARTYARHLQLG